MKLMKPKNVLVASAACAALVMASVLSTGQAMLKPGSQAGEFSAKGTDGKTHTLKSVTATGPVFFYFIKEDCPINADAVKYYTRLSAAYKDKAQLVGVFNGDEKQFANWQKRYKVPFTVLLDPDMKIIKGYKAQASPWVMEVDSKGKVAKVWPGYSAPMLNELSASMAGASKQSVAKVDFAGAPADTRYG